MREYLLPICTSDGSHRNPSDTSNSNSSSALLLMILCALCRKESRPAEGDRTRGFGTFDRLTAPASMPPDTRGFGAVAILNVHWEGPWDSLALPTQSLSAIFRDWRRWPSDVRLGRQRQTRLPLQTSKSKSKSEITADRWCWQLWGQLYSSSFTRFLSVPWRKVKARLTLLSWLWMM